MTLKPNAIPPVPETTKTIAQAAFPKGNLYMQMRDELGSIYTDTLFAELYSDEGQPGWSAWSVDPSWQSRTPGAFDASQFQVDWQAQLAT